jgi:hypothetical protein
MQRALALLAVPVLVFASIGCSGGSDSGDSGGTDDSDASSPTDAPIDETALAQAMLLVLEDFPTGWAEDKSDLQDDEESPFDECDTGPEIPPGRTGRAETGDFSDDSSSDISETVAVFADVESLSQEWDAVFSPSRADCFVGVVEDGKVNTDEVEYSDAAVSEVSFPSFGDRSYAQRVEMRYKLLGETGFGSEGSVFIDVVSVMVGRVVFSLEASDVLSPFDSDELTEYVRKAEAKVRRELR